MGQFSSFLGVHSLFVSRISREQKRNKGINLISKIKLMYAFAFRFKDLERAEKE